MLVHFRRLAVAEARTTRPHWSQDMDLDVQLIILDEYEAAHWLTVFKDVERDLGAAGGSSRRNWLAAAAGGA